MLRALVIAVCLIATAAFAAWQTPDERDVLWHVVQTCVLNHSITGAAFPCLFVDTREGVRRGYAVVRSPLERVHVVVTPTERTVGIEASRLRGPGAPNYFYDGWVARHFVIDALRREPRRSDLAMAVNSRLGRSQDQLHIHVACLRADVRKTLTRETPLIRADSWSRVKVVPNGPIYRARFVPSEDLAGVNVIDSAAEGLRVQPSAIHDITIVVAGTDAEPASKPAVPAGFVILARRRMPHGFDAPHGEALLDADCGRFGTP